MEILLVEDNQSDVFLFKMFLEDIGADANLIVFNDGSSVTDYLAKLKLSNNPCLPDLMVLDLNLPDESGFEILSEIKENFFLHDMKVIMFTTSSENEDKTYAKELGALEFFTKPIDISEYEKIVRLMCFLAASKSHQTII